MEDTIGPDSSNALNPDLDRDALEYLLSLEYPALKPERDFWTGHLTGPSGGRLGSAVILEWNIDADFPSPDDLHTMLDKHRDAVEAFVRNRDRKNALSAVDAERDRRIADGFMFDGAKYQSRPEDRENMSGAALGASIAISDGAQEGDLQWDGSGQDYHWIAADNTLVPMDAQTVVALGQAALDHKKAHIFAARTLKDMKPVPADFENDRYWPDTSGGKRPT